MHTVLRSIIVVIAMVAFSVTSAWAASDLDKFRGRVDKSAQDIEETADVTPNVVCVCKDGGQFNNRAGGLRSFVGTAAPGIDVVRVACTVLAFNTSGQVTGQFDCDTWELLPK